MGDLIIKKDLHWNVILNASVDIYALTISPIDSGQEISITDQNLVGTIVKYSTGWCCFVRKNNGEMVVVKDNVGTKGKAMQVVMGEINANEH